MRNIFIKYFNKSISESEKHILYTWLSNSNDNKRFFSEIRNKWIENGEIPINDINYTKRGFIHFSNRIAVLNKDKTSNSKVSILKIAAMVAIVISSSLLSFFIGHKNRVENTIVMNHVFMNEKNKGMVLLPDGSKAWLNANSKLIYPNQFSKDNRTIQLEGEAYFEVTRNELSPFLVETKEASIHVLGTSFNVKNYHDSKYVETTLVSGKVEVFLVDAEKSIVLSPNQRITCDKENKTFKIDQVKASDDIIWREDKLVCMNEPLHSILNKMRSWYNIEIACKKGVQLNQPLSLTIRQESPEEIFELLSIISPIQYNIEHNRVIISPRITTKK